MPAFATSNSRSGYPKVLFSDLDRTLLAHNYTIHPRVPLAIEKAREAGLQVIFTTARAPRSLMNVVGSLGSVELAICFNGGWIGDAAAGKATTVERLPSDLAASIMMDSHARSGNPIWYGEDEILVHEITPSISWQLAKVGEGADVENHFAARASGPCKIMCVDRRDKRCFEDLTTRWSAAAVLVQSDQVLLEIVPRSVSKGAAAKQVMAQLGLDPADCAAVGDAHNDVSMLDAVAFPCAVANAVDEVKQRAIYAGASCDDGGIADVIDWLLAPRWRQ